MILTMPVLLLVAGSGQLMIDVSLLPTLKSVVVALA